MKIKSEHVDHLRGEIAKVLEQFPDAVEAYETGNFHNSDRVKDLQKRFCFDLLHAADMHRYVCDVIYKYANDAHLYTALKAVCPTVTRRY